MLLLAMSSLPFERVQPLLDFLDFRVLHPVRVPARHAEVAQKHPQIPDVFRQSAALLRHSRLLECHFFLPALSVSLAAATSPSGRGKGLLQIQFSYRSTLGSPFGGAGA